MKDSVFSKEEWIEYAKDNLVLLYLDKPQNESLVPYKYQERNKELFSEYQVRSFPTFVLKDVQNDEIVSRVRGGSPEVTDFVNEVHNYVRYSKKSLNEFVSNSTGEDKVEAKKAVETLTVNQNELAELEKTYLETKMRLVSAIRKSKEEIKYKQEYTRIKAKGYSDEKAEEYVGLLKVESEIYDELEKWLASKPPQNYESQVIYRGFQSRVKEVRNQLAEF